MVIDLKLLTGDEPLYLNCLLSKSISSSGLLLVDKAQWEMSLWLIVYKLKRLLFYKGQSYLACPDCTSTTLSKISLLGVSSAGKEAGLQCWPVLWKHQRSLCWSSSAGLCHDDTRGCVVVLLDLQLASGYWSLASWYRRLRTSLSSVILGWTWPSLAVKKLIWWLGVGHDGPHGVGKEGVVVLVWYGQQRKVCPAKSWVHNQNAITVIGYSWYLLVRGSLRQLIAINNNNNNYNSSANSASPTAGLYLSLTF
ncbi:hypothetical protein MP228_006200 [Amoeboaphelidium protococcarum]|nr:hypothetical protein MP228_006200 [Amoeboaphelidium protococcarum]